MRGIRVFSIAFLIFALVIYHQSPVLSESSGPVDFLYKYSEKCDTNNKDAWNFTIKARKISRSVTGVTFWCYAKAPFDDKVGLQLDVAIRGTNGGGWKNSYNAYFPDSCNKLYATRPIFNKMVKDSNLTITKCPLPKGNIYLNEYILSIKDFGFPSTVFPYASLRIDATTMRNRKGIMCVRSYIDLVPQKRGGK